jgi:ABC-type multidrug transport system ATPase subunit
MGNKEDNPLNSEALAIEVKGITKSFGNHLALRGVDLGVKKGEFLTLFGPNGAGKTTLIKVLTTLLKPSAGSVRIAGLDIHDSSVTILRKIGVVSHQTFLYDELTAYENLKFYGKMYDVTNLEERIYDLITKVGLASRLHDRVRTLSRGMQQRLSIARAMIHNPSIILLDEPETGLDQYASAMLGEILNTLSTGEQTMVMTTHNLERGLEMGNRIAILAEGKIVYQESKQALNLGSLQEAYYQYTGASQ